MAPLRIISPFWMPKTLLLLLVWTVSNSVSQSSDTFKCPEQFGYYPDTVDCSKYFVCVFGDALHESCTGGLYFSVELQTCDWPRNVECANGVKPPIPKEAVTKPKDDSFSANRRNPPRSSRPQSPGTAAQGRSVGNGPSGNAGRTRFSVPDVEDDFDSSRNGRVRSSPAQTTPRATSPPRTTAATLPNTLPVTSTESIPQTFPITTTALQVYKNPQEFETRTDTSTQASGKDALDSLEDAGADPPNNRFPGYDPQQPQFEEAVPSVVDSEGRIHIPDGLYSNGPHVPGVSDISVFVKPIYDNDERDANDRKRPTSNDDDARAPQRKAVETAVYAPTPLYSNNGNSRDHDADRVIPSYADHQNDEEIAENDKREAIPEIASNNGNHKDPEEVTRYYRTSSNQDRSTPVIQIYNANPRENGPYPRLPSSQSNYGEGASRPHVVRYNGQPETEVRYENPTTYRETAPAPASSFREQTTGNAYAEVVIRQPVREAPVVQREPVREEPPREVVRDTSHREQAPSRTVYQDTRETPNRGPSYRNQPDQLRKLTTTVKPTQEPATVPSRDGSRYSTSNANTSNNRNRNSYRVNSSERPRQVTKEIPLQYVSTRHRQNGQSQQPAYSFTENPPRTDYNVYATPKPEVTDAPYEYGRVPYGYSEQYDDDEEDDQKAVFVATRPRSTTRPTTRATRPRTTTLSTTTTTTTTTPAPTTPVNSRGSNRRPMPSGLNRPVTRPPSTEPKAPPKPPSRPASHYPTPAPYSTATKCSSRTCKLPDCRCGGTDTPGAIPNSDVPQVVLLTFDDAVNDLNYDLYEDIFTTRKNPNGCPILGTFYVSHEWTDYGKIQTLYAQGHEMASHSVTHSYGEKFSKQQWHKEINGQREILHLYGGVNLEDVRGMRAPFLQIGGNKMFEMLHEANFTYDSSMPVFENNPPFWPYTTDYAINHECMITPCPSKSFPGIWEVGMVMWIDLRGGRCSMGDACSNPTDEEGVYKMLIKNFNRHYKSNRAPFGLYYHSAWFSTQHHRKGFFRFLDEINAKDDVWLITNWQLIQWMRNPTPTSRINSFEPWQCNPSPNKPPICRNPTVCNVWDRGGVRYMKTCQPCPSKYPWLGKTGFEG